MPVLHQDLIALATWLRAHQPQLLEAWREAVGRDPELPTAATISRSQFIDHMPQVLEAFARQLSAFDQAHRAQASEEEHRGAGNYGSGRRQQGYQQREAVREWGHLHLCLLDAIESFGREHPEVSLLAMHAARRTLAELINTALCESIERYTQLQRSEASTRVRELERAVTQVRMLEHKRAEIWREAAHDLRGRVGTLSNVKRLLDQADLPDPARERFSHILSGGIASLEELLGDLMDLSRLEAGHDRRVVAQFDAGRLLENFCETYRPQAEDRGLFLQSEGPPSVPVEGDAAKVQRIAQNLLLNAFKATERGGIRITWHEEDGTPGCRHWTLCVQDTGIGFDPTQAALLNVALKQATGTAHDLNQSAKAGDQVRSAGATSTALHTDSKGGEGIGLSIVKRLCELLDARLELESAPGHGATFRVTFPRTYVD